MFKLFIACPAVPLEKAIAPPSLDGFVQYRGPDFMRCRTARGFIHKTAKIIQFRFYLAEHLALVRVYFMRGAEKVSLVYVDLEASGRWRVMTEQQFTEFAGNLNWCRAEMNVLARRPM
jgi:hypothetical protein